MTAALKVKIDGWENGGPIPGKFAFGVPAAEGHVALSENRSPAISWSDAPEDTKSFAIICHDPDVPSSGEDVNQEGKTVPASLPRVDFYHWVQVDIPLEYSSLAEGEVTDGITAKG
ncbi:MAG: YbhB/YbcL family Raf kinase inhibitor-like protein, partial [Sneathiella sp.]